MYGLAVYLDEALKARGWTQRQLAEASGMSPSAVSRVISGELIPSVGQVQALADAVGADAEQAEILAGLDTPSGRTRHALALQRNENRALRARVLELESALSAARQRAGLERAS